MPNNSGATFTTSYLPNSPGLELKVPLGFILSPMAFTNDDKKNQQHYLTNSDMVTCELCSSYLNKYCSYEYNTAKWTCPICYHVNEASYYGDDTKRHHILNADIVEYHEPAKTRRKNGLTHTHTELLGTAPLASSSSSSQLTMIVIDGNLPSEEVQSIFQHLSSILSTESKQYIGLIIYTSIINFYQLGIHGDLASADVYSFRQYDESTYTYYEYPHEEGDGINVDELNDNKDRMYVGSFEQAILCASSYFGFRYGSSIDSSNNDFNNGPINMKCTTSNNSNTDTKLSRKEILREKRENRQHEKSIFQKVDLDECTPEKSAQYINYLRDRPNNKRKTLSLKKKQRCTGEAVAYAYKLLATCICKDQDYDTGRILLFTNGCSNYGKCNVTQTKNEDIMNGSEFSTVRDNNQGDVIDPIQLANASKCFSQIGKECFDFRIAIDVFCSGSSSTLGSQAFLSLVECSSGYVLSHNDFRGQQFEQNLKYVLSSTYVVNKHDVNACLLDIRMSDGISPKSINGSIVFIDQDHKHFMLPNEVTKSPLHLDTMDATRTRLQLGRFDPKSTVSVMIQIDKKLQSKDAVFQFIMRYANPHDASDFITRVISQRLEVVHKDYGSQFFDSLEKDTLSVLLAKEAAYRCMVHDIGRSQEDLTYDHEEIEELVLRTQEELDTTCHRIIRTCKEMSNEAIAVDIEQRDIRESLPELEVVFKRLHHFRRGTILGSNTQSSDDRSLLRNLFLKMPLHDCLMMMAPKLWMYYFGDNGEIVSTIVPAETPVLLHDNCVIAADNFDSMFIWSGSGTQTHEHEILRERCKYRFQVASKNRFPSPITYTFNDGDSMARRFTSRLVPSHGDKVKEWRKNFPLLPSKAANNTRFHIYDKSSGDSSFRHWFGFVTDLKSKNWDYELSLCDYPKIN